ncbi:MAG: prepilin-type N-terminal cleavage/methylation domain-containing protein [Candidatus Omnitrophica bacterium]|nr:prepilin-type N-terminal cleavage/methylation domain-containing protein [Candidatus Omnitrophota bacterium]
MCWGRRKTSLAGFTLIELIAVVIIVAILISLAVPQYTKTIERAKEKEAIANLKLMQAAQKIYKLEQGFFYPGSGGPSIDEINENLRLDLNENQWQYNVPATGTDDDFSAMAYRGDWKTRTYSIDQDLTEPVCSPSANCP